LVNGDRTLVDFDQAFLEINGRKPTVLETKRHLAFDRLAKTTDLDPATLLLIVEASHKPTHKSSFQITARPRDLCVFAITLLIFILAAITTSGLPPPPFVVLVAMFVCGQCSTLMYLWLPPIFSGWK
jgi:hypothetical protein